MAEVHDAQEKELLQGNGKVKKSRTQFNDEDDELTKVNTELTCYEKTINCCGSFWGTLRAWCPCFCFCCPYPYYLLRQGNKGLLQKFGKFQRILDPGLHEINPCTDQVLPVSTKTFVIDLARQLILTKDNLVVNIDTIVYYRIVEVRKASYRVKKIQDCVMEITYATLRTVCGEHTLQDILQNRQQIADEIEAFVFDVVSEWGIYVEQVFIKDMVMNPQLQSSLSMAPKIKRLSEAKIISAQSDVEAAKLLRKASDMLNSKAAMQIRYFETIQRISKNSNPKVLFLPLQDKK